MFHLKKNAPLFQDLLKQKQKIK